MAHMSCKTLDSNYTAHIKYLNSTQTVSVDVAEGQPLNASSLNRSSLFYDILNSVPTETGFAYKSPIQYNFTSEELSNIYHGSQLRSIRDTLVQALSGAISTFGAENYFTINTIMQESKRADPVYNMSMFTFSRIFFDLSTSVVEDYMKNVTIAMLNDSGKNYSTLVETVIYKSAYVFKNELRLIGAYGGALFLCLAFLLLGFGALHQNGTSASTGGFLQIMCTTTHGDGTMNQLAKGASLGGEIGVPKDLLDLKVRFGVVANGTGQTKHAAFGTVEDTEPLVKGL
ncbi:hypothetical protein L13192_05460 [Pyrenophora tritici-repentis]|nr:hypothetical protein L13192_05460 [Pyrenophora tritici-repentis]